MIQIIKSLAPFPASMLIDKWVAGLHPEQTARIAAHERVAIEAARRNDAIGAAAFQKALDAMGIGLFARDLWGPCVAYVQQAGH